MEIAALFADLENWLRGSHPLWLIAAMVFLPLIPFPISPLWMLAGLRFGFFGGVVVSSFALLLNLSLAYGVALLLGRPIISRLLALVGKKVPKIPPEDEVKWIFIFRITPGIPLLLQNYSLGVARVGFGRYLAISLPVQMAYATAFILFGSALFSGKTGWAISGGLLALSLLLILRILQKRILRQSRPPLHEETA